MGSLIGGVVAGIGSLFGSNQAAKKEDEAAKSALTGFNYLNTNQNNQVTQNAGTQSAYAGQDIQNMEQQLLGVREAAPGTVDAFHNYLNSTGYGFQLDQGSKAITGNAAAKGFLNSGATAKALTGFGQNLASNYFNSYLGQLQATNGQAQQSAQLGLQASDAVGAAGTTGGNNAGNFQAQAGQSTGTGTAQAFNYFGGAAQNAFGNVFGSIGGGGNGAGAPQMFNGLVP